MKNSTRSETETYDRRLQIANNAATVAITLISLLTFAGCAAAFRTGLHVSSYGTTLAEGTTAAIATAAFFSCAVFMGGLMLLIVVMMEKGEYLARIGKQPSTDRDPAGKQPPLIRSFNGGAIHLVSDPESGAQYLVSRVRYWARYRLWSLWTMERVEHEDIGVGLSVAFTMPLDRGREAVNRRLAETFHSAQAHAASERRQNQAAVRIEKEAALAG